MPRHLKPPKIYFFILSIAVAILLSFVLSFILKNFLKNLSYFKTLRNLQNLSRENLQLKAKNLELSKVIYSQKDLILENQQLKKMLNLKEKYSTILIPATIISKNPWSWNKEISINKGSEDGIYLGNLAIDFQANLVGKVEKLNEKSSWIRLISDPNFKITVNCGELNTLLVGALFEGAKLLYVPYDFSLDIKDKIRLPNSLKFGFDIQVGEVSFIKKSRSSLTQDIFVRPYVDVNNLHEVFILKDSSHL